jgi:hypothetical protein
VEGRHVNHDETKHGVFADSHYQHRAYSPACCVARASALSDDGTVGTASLLLALTEASQKSLHAQTRADRAHALAALLLLLLLQLLKGASGCTTAVPLDVGYDECVRHDNDAHVMLGMC